MSATCFFSISPPTIIMATVWPPKRRRTGHKLPSMVDGSDLSLDTAMYIHSEERERILVPVWSNGPTQANVQPEAKSKPEPESHQDFSQNFQQAADAEINSQHQDTRNRCFYMKQFVAQVDGILQAMQVREALPNSRNCANCSEFVGHWRCNDWSSFPSPTLSAWTPVRLCWTHWTQPFR